MKMDLSCVHLWCTRFPPLVRLWWCAYVLVLAFQYQIAGGYDSLLMAFFNGGLFLAALLHIGRRLGSIRWMAAFSILIFGSDWLLMVVLAETPAVMSMAITATLVLQGWLGYFFLHLLNLQRELPDTQKKVIWFSWAAALFPVLVSSLIMTVLALYLGATADPETLGVNFLWWSVSRFTSIVLVAPAVLFIVDRYESGTSVEWENEFLVFTLGAVLFALVLFSVANPPGRELASYSYLLLPVLLVASVRFPLYQSLLILLLVGLASHAGDAIAASTPELLRQSSIALAVFLCINCAVVWHMGVLTRERTRALASERRQRSMYEMLSRVNQAIVKSGFDRDAMFNQVCQAILDEGGYQQACIAAIGGTPTEGVCLTKHTDGGDGPVGCVSAFPIYQRGTLVAELTVTANACGDFDDDARRVFQEMSDDLGLALAMHEQETHLKQVAEVFQHSQESIIIANTKGTILNVNPAFTRITGYSRDEALGNNPRMLSSGRQGRGFYQKLFEQLLRDGFWSGQFWNKRKNGDCYLQRGTISAVFSENGKPEHYIAIMEDVSTYHEAEEKIEALANYDPLTGLPNRVLLEERFARAFAHARQTRSVWSLLFIDLDDFKQVNDALGHHYGDELLKAVCQRLVSHVRDGDTLCRFGGDEFILLMQGGAKEAGRLAQRLINEVSRVFDIEGAQLHIGASVGVAVLFLDGDTLGELIQAADTALYHAKSDGRGRVSFFAKSMQDKAQFRLALKPALQKAMAENELFLLFQPKVERLPDGQFRAVGYEALVRWNHPETGMVSPGEFIPAAEDSGQIVEVDRWVLETAVRQVAQWMKEGHGSALPVAINVSAALFSRPEFVSDLQRLMERAGVPPRLIELEITEHAATVDIDNTLKTLRELRVRGFRLAIDDFGTGYSSLSYLREFPINHLKIDLSFVRDVHLDLKKQGLVKAIIAMAHSLDLSTIAEGVEAKEELEFLLENGCDVFQGYYFSKPVSATECTTVDLSSVIA
jgi:diguanylate cyclase (GGDEF)-like protein/PAS domain S-box-containing protein